jgi:hypothetical protein
LKGRSDERRSVALPPSESLLYYHWYVFPLTIVVPHAFISNVAFLVVAILEAAFLLMAFIGMAFIAMALKLYG